MAQSSRPVQDQETEEKTFSSRNDSHHTPRAYEPLSRTPYQFSPPQTMVRTSMSPTKAFFGPDAARPSPRARDQKQVTFELLLTSAQSKARLPMRVMISKHDTTESIITTVKNFYGLYEGGVSFQDRDGNIMIAAYDNFDAGMTVYVKVSEDLSLLANNDVPTPVSTSPKKPKLGPPIEMRPPAYRHTAFNSADRSPSPSSFKTSQAAINAKAKSRTIKSEPSNGMEDQFSDSDGGNASVASSRRSRADAHASAEISVDNILEGGRRKRAKFESCELPLFVPPQVPVTTSLSSVSPQRRLHGEAASPLPITNHRTFAYPLPSPQSFGRSDGSWGSGGYMINATPGQNGNQRGRPSLGSHAPRRSGGGVILPTPEPTVGGSVISDEDVALQLMRLGDMANMSHGRTSTSTIDDALSGKAEAASSEEESESDTEDLSLPEPRFPFKPTHSHALGPARKKQRTEGSAHGDCCSSDDSDHEHDGSSFREGTSDPAMDEDLRRSGQSSLQRAPSSKPKTIKPGQKGKPVDAPVARKTSISTAPLAPDEEDLSSRPRCQRCRKSKKGCDRQRPCGRCKDAGIGIEGCVSEDEGNGRRGRYGRHMGVVVKKDGKELPVGSVEAVGAGGVVHEGMGGQGGFLTPALPGQTKVAGAGLAGVKRKRSL